MTRQTSTSRLHHPAGDLLALADGINQPLRSEKPAPERRNCWTCAHGSERPGDCTVPPDASHLFNAVEDWWACTLELDWSDPCPSDADDCPGWRKRD